MKINCSWIVYWHWNHGFISLFFCLSYIYEVYESWKSLMGQVLLGPNSWIVLPGNTSHVKALQVAVPFSFYFFLPQIGTCCVLYLVLFFTWFCSLAPSASQCESSWWKLPEKYVSQSGTVRWVGFSPASKAKISSKTADTQKQIGTEKASVFATADLPRRFGINHLPASSFCDCLDDVRK